MILSLSVIVPEQELRHFESKKLEIRDERLTLVQYLVETLHPVQLRHRVYCTPFE